MSILKKLEQALGRHAELSEYAPEVEAVVGDLAARVERLESFAPASMPEPAAAPDPTPTPTSEATSSAADAGGSSAGTAPDVASGSTTVTATIPAEQGEPGQV